MSRVGEDKMSLKQLADLANDNLCNCNWVQAEISARQAWEEFKRKHSKNKNINHCMNGYTALRTLTQVLCRQHRMEELEALGREALKFPVYALEGHEILAIVHNSKGENDIALEHAEQLKRIMGPEREPYWLPIFINIHLFQGRYELAMQELKDWCKPCSLAVCLDDRSLDALVKTFSPFVIIMGTGNRLDLAQEALHYFKEGVIRATTGMTPRKIISNVFPAYAKDNQPVKIDAQLLPKIIRAYDFKMLELEALIDAFDSFNKEGKTSQKGAYRTTKNAFFTKIGKPETVQREIAVVDNLMDTVLRLYSELGTFVLAMPNYNFIEVAARSNMIISVSNAGTILEDALGGLMQDGKFTAKEPSLLLNENHSEHCVVSVECKPSSPSAAIEDILRKTVQQYAVVHAIGPVELAKPPLSAEQNSCHVHNRIAGADYGFSNEDIAIVDKAVIPISKKLEQAFKTFVKDGNPRNAGIDLGSGRNKDIAFEEITRLGPGRAVVKVKEDPYKPDEFRIRVFDFETALIASPHYDLIKLLEHDRYLPREKVDAITQGYIAEYNNAVETARSMRINRKKITDPEAFELDRENWRIVQYISSYHHPNYSDPKYWKNKAFWMERGAETVDVLLTKYSDKYRKEELEAISQLKPVFEKYLRIAEAQVKK
jgi:hypothetical protein